MQALARNRKDPLIGERMNSPRLLARYAHLRNVITSLGFYEVPVAGYLKFIGNDKGRKVTLTAAARFRNRYSTPDISRRRFHGMILSAQLESTLQTRVLISKANLGLSWLIHWFQKLNGNARLHGLGSAYPGYNVWASDLEWSKEFLLSPQVRSQLQPLLYDTQKKAMGHTIHIGLNACGFTPAWVPPEVTASEIDGWLGQLSATIQLAEKAPPKTVAKPTWWEKQTAKGNLPFLVVAMLLAAPFLLMLIIGVPIVAIILVLMLLG